MQNLYGTLIGLETQVFVLQCPVNIWFSAQGAYIGSSREGIYFMIFFNLIIPEVPKLQTMNLVKSAQIDLN